MGIENREYMRDESSPMWRGRSDHPWLQDVVKTLIIVNVVIFILQLLTVQTLPVEPLSREEFGQRYEIESGDQRSIERDYQRYLRIMAANPQFQRVSLVTEWLALDTDKVLRGQIWRLTTYDFLHSTSSFWHIFLNMLVLYMAGRRVADRYGDWEFLWFYLVSGVFSAAFFILWSFITKDFGSAVGASGAVSAVLVVYAMNWPRHTWLIYGIIPVPAIVLVIFMAAMDLYPMLMQLSGGVGFSGGVFAGRIAHSAHIGGMLFGFMYYKTGWMLTSFLPSRFSMSRLQWGRRNKLRVHRPIEAPHNSAPERPPIPAHVEQRVDEILEKISALGEASLTPEERQFLNESSRKYRR